MIRCALILTTMLAVATPLPAAAAPASDTAAVTRLVDDFVAAEKAFDPATLARLTTPDYAEVSPLGEFDTREKMLAFYAPANRQPAPPMTLADRIVRIAGPVAILSARLTLGPAAVRAVYVARRERGTWRLMSTQFTPIRPGRGS